MALTTLILRHVAVREYRRKSVNLSRLVSGVEQFASLINVSWLMLGALFRRCQVSRRNYTR